MEKRAIPGALVLASAASGAAALVYEVLWVRRLGDLIGSTAHAVAAVLSVFFLGLGLGAWLLGRQADRIAEPWRLFVALELVVAAWGIAFWWLSGWIDELYVATAPAQLSGPAGALAKGAIALALLLPPATAMGGALPALVRHVVRRASDYGPRLGVLYGANTLGGAVGVLAAVFLLMPGLGLIETGLVAAALNLTAAGCAWTARRSAAEVPFEARAAREEASTLAQAASARSGTVVLGAAFLAGAVSIGLEVLWTRALAMRFSSTIYSFGIILASFLLGLGLGALATGWLDRRGLVGGMAAAATMALSGIAGLVSTAVLARIEPLATAGAGAPASFAALALAEFAGACAVVAVPAWLFGLNLPILCRLLLREVESVGRALGRVLLANTAGSVLAPLLCGFVLLPALGLDGAILALCWTAIAFAVFVLLPWAAPPRSTAIAFACVALPAALGAQIAVGGSLRVWSETPGDRLLHYEDTFAASIAVVEGADRRRILKIDNAYHLGGTHARFAQERQGLIPLLLSGQPRSALFIGLGTGSSAGAAVELGIERTDVVEILPGLGALLPWFGPTGASLAAAFRDGRARLLEVDGRHFVRGTSERYDVVVGDLFVPWRAGEGGMYTLEHFQAVREVLEPGGSFCQWLPLYQLSHSELATIAATFCEAFPSVEVFWLYLNVEQPAIGLVGSREPLAVDLASLAEGLGRAERREVLARNGLAEPASLIGLWIAGRERLAAWAAGAPLERRSRPRVEFLAPRHRFGAARPPQDSNTLLMLELAQPLAECGFLAGAESDALRDLARHREAVQHFMRGRHALALRGDPRRGIAELRRAIELTPEWDWIAWNLEQACAAAFEAGQLERLDEAAFALSVSPAHGHVGLYWNARASTARGEFEGARRLLERSLELEPGFGPSEDLLRQLERKP